MNQPIPLDHQLLCDGCGKILDMRDASCLVHGWLEDGQIKCYDDIKVPYSSSKKVGEPVQWTADKKQIDLN